MDKGTHSRKPPQASEAELDRFLEGDSPVTEAYQRLAKTEPGEELDRAILDAARKQLKPARQRWLEVDLRFWRHWSRPIATVVIAGFCLAVVLQVMETTTWIPMEFYGQGVGSTARESTMLREKDEQRLDSLRREQVPADMPAQRSPSESKSESPASDMVVAARQRPVLQEKSASELMTQPEIAPAEAVGGQALEEIIVADTGQDSYLLSEPADGAADAWELGARPTAEVWLAGIDALRDEGESKIADDELRRLAAAYPEALEAVSPEPHTDVAGARYLAAGNEIAEEEDVPYPQPRVWLAGIDWLERQGLQEQAAAERAKFAKIYPSYLDKTMPN